MGVTVRRSEGQPATDRAAARRQRGVDVLTHGHRHIAFILTRMDGTEENMLMTLRPADWISNFVRAADLDRALAIANRLFFNHSTGIRGSMPFVAYDQRRRTLVGGAFPAVQLMGDNCHLPPMPKVACCQTCGAVGEHTCPA